MIPQPHIIYCSDGFFLHIIPDESPKEINWTITDLSSPENTHTNTPDNPSLSTNACHHQNWNKTLIIKLLLAMMARMVLASIFMGRVSCYRVYVMFIGGLLGLSCFVVGVVLCVRGDRKRMCFWGLVFSEYACQVFFFSTLHIGWKRAQNIERAFVVRWASSEFAKWETKNCHFIAFHNSNYYIPSFLHTQHPTHIKDTH